MCGAASLHPDDANHASKYAGCRYAEIRATIKYIKMKKRVLRNEIKLLNKLINNIITQKKSKELLIKEYNNILEDIKYCNDVINSLHISLKTTIEERDKLINKNA